MVEETDENHRSATSNLYFVTIKLYQALNPTGRNQTWNFLPASHWLPWK